MFFVLIILAIFVIVSIYFYFRSERLQADLLRHKRESAGTRKDNKHLVDMFVMLAAKQEELYQFRFNKVKAVAEEQAPSVASEMGAIAPLVNNFAGVFRECSSGKQSLKAVAEQCFENYKPGSFKEFLRFISSQEKHIKRMWSMNNLVGFLSMMEALLNEAHSNIDKVKDKKKAAERAEEIIQNF
jgi:hypothetical protein